MRIPDGIFCQNIPLRLLFQAPSRANFAITVKKKFTMKTSFYLSIVLAAGLVFSGCSEKPDEVISEDLF